VKREVVTGGEFDWFAMDGEGHVGHFATAGFRPIPRIVLARFGELREFDRRILQLPAIGEATGHLGGLIEDWLEMARRGLFSYDWQHWSGPYARAATPSRAINIAEIPAALRDDIRIVEWPGNRFKDFLAVRP